MPLKVLCAGCPKDEREPAESAVKAALGQAPGSWTVSLVKIGPQWSVTVDGPDVKHKTVMVPHGGIRQAIQEMVPSMPAPPAKAPSPPAAARPAPGAPLPRAPLPPTRSAPTPAPAAARPVTPAAVGRSPSPPAGRTPASPHRIPHSPKAGERQDRYDCQYCGGAFVVIYEAAADSGQETVAVACPHCWKNSHVMVAEEAALSRDYRAEKT